MTLFRPESNPRIVLLSGCPVSVVNPCFCGQAVTAFFWSGVTGKSTYTRLQFSPTLACGFSSKHTFQLTMPLINEPNNRDELSFNESKELWRHSSPHTTQIYDFMKKSGQKHGVSFDSYHDLWRWSVSEPAQFWEDIWHYTTVKAHKPYDKVSTNHH